MSEQPTETVAPGPPGASPRPVPLERGATVGRYIILDLLGSGGMGVVYAAYDPELDRKVALKLLRPDRVREASRLRLLREAQAVARLSHPNVVAVYDAGALDDQVFVAMELVEGRNLRQWLEAEPRSWQQTVAVLLAAGRGLAAAHAAGLVHRDVKPDNVLIGEDGRVRMADFGIACRSGEPDAEAWAAGTPAYMAPEQRRGEPADARSDQYGFCVTLWESLFGERPPAGEDRRVPSWLRQALLRGLSEDPADRHPSLGSLLAVLERDPAAVRRRWSAVAAVAVAAGASLFAWEKGRESRAELCQAGEARLAGVWDGRRKTEIQAAFTAARASGAAGAWSDAARTLDGYAARWTSMYREACEATWLRGEQSEDLLDRRMLCLDRRLRDLDALAGVFVRADARVVAQAGPAARSLTGLGECADRDALLRRTPPPADPAARARIAEAETRLSEASALFWAGKYTPALAAATLVGRRADALAYPPLQADAYLMLGDIQEALGAYAQAESALYLAAWAADRGADDVRRAWIWRKLAYTVGYRLGRPGEAVRLLHNGKAALARIGPHPRLESSLLNTEAGLLVFQQRYREAVPLYRRSLGISARDDPGDAQMYIVYANLGEVVLALGQAEQARIYQQKALDLASRSLPADQPLLDSIRLYLCNALVELGRFEEALPVLQRIAANREAQLGPEHPELAETLAALGAAWIDQGQPARGLPPLRRAVALYEKTAPAGYPYHEQARVQLGRALLLQGDLRDAEAQLRQALAALETTQEPGSPLLALPLLSLGRLHLEKGRPADAVPLLERAVALLDRTSTYPRQRAEAAALLARARGEG